MIKKIREHINWRRAWAARDRIAFLKQFTPKSISFFVEDGCPEWQDPFDRRPNQSYSTIYRSWIAANEQGTIGEEDRTDRGSLESEIRNLDQAEAQGWRVV